MARRRRVKKIKNPAERRAAEIVRGGDDLAVPDCKWHADCGGCRWQRLGYARQISEKQDLIRSAFAAHGFIPDTLPIEPLVSAPSLYGYRNHMEFSFSARRWLSRREIASGRDLDRDFSLGLHSPGGIGRVLDIDRCSIQAATGNRILDVVREFAKSSGLGAWNHREHSGFWRFLRVRRGVATGDWLVAPITARREPRVMKDLSRALLGAGIPLTTLANGVTDRVADTSEGSVWHTDYGPETFREALDGLEFAISAESFFQPNTETAALIFRLVGELAGLRGDERVLDLFCGTGTLALHVARRVRNVRGLELSEASVACARDNAAGNAIDNVAFDVADLIGGLSENEVDGIDVVVTDPPRAGMHERLVRDLAKARPPKIVSVGCNPVTQARDLRILVEEGKYTIERMIGVDQFPHTPHVENVALLVAPR